MELSTYLNFNGECAAAFKFYEGLLGGRIVMMQTHGESPMKEHVPADWQDKVLHARLVLDQQALMGSDAPPERYAAPQGIYVSLKSATNLHAGPPGCCDRSTWKRPTTYERRWMPSTPPTRAGCSRR